MATTVIALCVGILGACAPAPLQAPQPPPTVDVWMAGDSLAAGTANFMIPRPYNAAKGAAGFTSFSRTKILDNTQEMIDLYGPPSVVIAMGGVTDTNRGLTTSTITDGMVEFQEAMDAQGIEVVWLAEPAWQRAAELTPVSDWLLQTYDAIDCRAHTGPVGQDGIHPVSYRTFSSCVNSELTTRGVEFG
jgi:hypothetical protein